MPISDTEVEEVVVQETAVAPARTFALQGNSLSRIALLTVIAIAATAVNGYHPYGEDAGIYVAGIKQAANKDIFGSSSFFIAPYLQLSMFSVWNAWLVRLLHLRIEYVLLALQIGTTWLLLVSCWELARRCFRAPEERWASVLLVAVCLSVPVAGSSLFMMDPYLTSRSFSTPLTLLAICACLDGKIPRTLLLLALAALFHPLMSIYAIGFVLLLWAIRRESWTGVAALVAAALGAGAIVQYSQRFVEESAAYRAAIATRYYVFLYRWQWYELFGLAAPLLLLLIYSKWARTRGKHRGGNGETVVLAQTCVVLGITAIAVSLLFARPSSHSHLVAALQTIRPFLIVYFCMFLLLGGLLGGFWLKRIVWRWVVLFAGLSAGLGMAQHLVYPASAQVELPWVVSSNAWNQAFMWIRQNTPANAVFALDADYIHAAGEDAQGFRAIAERSSLADLSKDGGAAAVFPQLAERWMREQAATANLNSIDDGERLRRLTPFHVTWIVLETSAFTAFECPFRNERVKVCRLP